jgi:hypothetical protein
VKGFSHSLAQKEYRPQRFAEASHVWNPRPRNDVLGYQEFHVFVDLTTDGYGSTGPLLGSQFQEVSPPWRKFTQAPFGPADYECGMCDRQVAVPEDNTSQRALRQPLKSGQDEQ